MLLHLFSATTYPPHKAGEYNVFNSACKSSQDMYAQLAMKHGVYKKCTFDEETFVCGCICFLRGNGHKIKPV